jgi:hypothetical protein
LKLGRLVFLEDHCSTSFNKVLHLSASTSEEKSYPPPSSLDTYHNYEKLEKELKDLEKR